MKARDAKEMTRQNNSTRRDDNDTYKDAIRVITQAAIKGDSSAEFPVRLLIGNAKLSTLKDRLKMDGFDIRENLIDLAVTDIIISW